MKQLLVTSNSWRSFGGIEENYDRLHLVVFSELRKVSSVRAVVAGDPHEAALTEAVKLSDGAGQLDPDLNSFGPGVLESAMAASKASTPTTRSSKPLEEPDLSDAGRLQSRRGLCGSRSFHAAA